MFTGLVEAQGTVRGITQEGTGRLLEIAEPHIAPELTDGESVAVNGVCLSVVARTADSFRFQVGPETLRCTNLGELAPGQRVNLERSLAVGARLGGHIVQGHVDGIGQVMSRRPEQGWDLVWIQCPGELAQYMIRKGSVAVDGVSLTLVDVAATAFSVALIPLTLSLTTLGFKQPGATVNLEVDLFAKYMARFLEQWKLGGLDELRHHAPNRRDSTCPL